MRQSQTILYNQEFPETCSSTTYSRQRAFSRLSALSSIPGSNSSRIPRSSSMPYNQTQTANIPQRLTKSAVGNIQRKTPEKELKCQFQLMDLSENQKKSSLSITDSKQSDIGVGVLLCLDIIEKKGQFAVR